MPKAATKKTAKKSAAKKPAKKSARKVVAKKATRKGAVKKASAKKTSARRTTAKKSAGKKGAAKKSAANARRPSARKRCQCRPPDRRSRRQPPDRLARCGVSADQARSSAVRPRLISLFVLGVRSEALVFVLVGRPTCHASAWRRVFVVASRLTFGSVKPGETLVACWEECAARAQCRTASVRPLWSLRNERKLFLVRRGWSARHGPYGVEFAA